MKRSENIKMKCLLLILLAFASEGNENIFEREIESGGQNGERSIVVKIEEDEFFKADRSHFIGVSYNKRDDRWTAQRWSKNESKIVCNGTAYKDAETAAHASDTLARKFVKNGEKGHRLNFPDDDTEVYTEKRSNKIGITYEPRTSKWNVRRWSKNENKLIYNGSFKDAETAAHASDTLARKLIANGEKGHKLNFPDDVTEVYPQKSYDYFGVNYNKRYKTWVASRYCKYEGKVVYNGTYYKDVETAARASDILARKFIKNGEKSHKLNFPDDATERQKSKRKRPKNLKD